MIILGRVIDLTGQRFGKLTVIEKSGIKNGSVLWKCKCDCGNYTEVITALLRNGSVSSCGCLAKLNRCIDITNQKFNRLTAIKYAGKGKWLCRCDCGNEITVNTAHLRSGHTKSCGCLQRENTSKANQINILGKKFGNLTVIAVESPRKCTCRCDCGNIVHVARKKLTNGTFMDCSDVATIDVVGKKFGSLTVVAQKGSNCVCQCDCGNTIELKYGRLSSGQIKSCGCHRTKYGIRNNISGQRFGKLTAISATRRNGRTYWTCKCDCGNTCEIELSHLPYRTCCPECSQHIGIIGSKEELAIKNYVDNLIHNESRKEKVLDGKEIDIFYPSLNLGIEYNGSKFHATLGSAFDNKHKLYHQDKFLLAKEKGIHLINIFDVDWANNQDKIKMYLRSLVVPQKRLFARKCKVKEISREMAVNFTDKYHIQGSVSRFMKINYGLFFNDELYAVMSFGKLRLSKTDDGQYELHRYCVKDGYTILGGAEKLLKHFEIDYSPKYIRSYSDNDYFMGGIYERLGFENAGQCTPRYYWYLNGVELRREACQLKRLKEDYPELLQEAYDKEAPNKEDYVMLKLGACKVYRSGNTKWEKRY